MAITIVAAKPVESGEGYDDESYDPAVVYEPADDQPEEPVPTYEDGSSEERSKRSPLTDEQANRNFFNSINNNINRQVRRAQGEVPTIQLGDLLSAVEHTLVHSAQNLAIANATNTTSFNSTETSTVIALPITFPTASTTELALLDETSATEEPKIYVTEPSTDEVTDDALKRDSRKAEESIKPIESNGNLSLLSSITFSPSKSDDEIKIRELSPSEVTIKPEEVTMDLATTEEAPTSESSNITIIQTINSTQVSPADSDSVVRVQQQHITLFSAGAGIFPSLPSINLDLLTSSTTQETPAETDCLESSSEGSGESSSSHESNEKSLSDEKSTSSEKSSSDEKSFSDESDEKNTTKKCQSKVDSSTSSTTASPSTKKEESLQEKIAEVEADPVILTQGI